MREVAVAATTGFFDGVHIGHRQVLSELVSRGEESLVVTFWPHPRTVLQQDARELRLLTSLSEKEELIRACGVSRVEVLHFSRSFASLTAAEYLRLLRDRYGVSTLVVGYDNRLGSDHVSASGVASLASSMDMSCVVVPALGTVSSTKIRTLLEEGDVVAAASMLGRNYSLSGVVVPGNRLGRTIGFPTANMGLCEPLKLVPGNGVYATEVSLQGRFFRGMTNIGVRPTVETSTRRTIETHILDFDEDIYGLPLTVTFLRRIRSERQFPSLEALSAQLRLDKAAAL